MHEEAKKFVVFVKSILLEYFINKIVLDVKEKLIYTHIALIIRNTVYIVKVV
jgi:hypothetical protein